MEKPGIEPATPGLQGIALIHYTTGASLKNFLWLSLGRNQYRREGLWFVCLLYDGSTRRLTESGFMWFYGFMEKPGIEPATPDLQGKKNFLWLSLGRNQYRQEGLWFVCLLYDGSTRRLTESGFMWFYGEAGNRTCDPWFTRHSAYQLHHGGKKKKKKTFCGFSMGRNQYWAGRVYVCLLYDGNTRRLNRKWFYGEAGNRTCDPWFTRHSAYPLHHGGFDRLWPFFLFSPDHFVVNHIDFITRSYQLYVVFYNNKS